MAKDAVATMGMILEPDVGGRDAVHVAVISAEAADKLAPGQHVGFNAASTLEKLIVGISDDPIGLVDPFLEVTVQKGQRFWLYLYPRTITSLRHNWTHPAFSDAPLGAFYAPPSQKLEAEKWLLQYAREIGVTYRELMERADDYVASRQYWIEGGRWEGQSLPDEFWDHYQTVMDTKIPDDKRGSFFSCSC